MEAKYELEANDAIAIAQTGRMTPGAYQSERDRIRATYGDSSAEAGAQREQALALLFARSGWSQEELAQAEGVKQQHIARRLLFGRFLASTPSGSNSQIPPRNLSERRFRGYWERSDKAETNERIRFGEVQRLMQADTMLAKKRDHTVAPRIVEQFGDGKWHRLETIAEHVKAEAPDVHNILRNMLHRGDHGTHVEHKQVGASWSYRIVKKSDARMVPLAMLEEELGPLLKELDHQGKLSMARVSPETLRHIAFQIRKVLEKLAK